MSKISSLLLYFLVLVGCVQEAETNDYTEHNSTLYAEPWDGETVIVEKRNEDGDYITINEITDAQQVEKLMSELKDAEWEEHVGIDIGPADYEFTWNSYEHGVWINEMTNRLELMVYSESNYGTLSMDSSKQVLRMLVGE